MLFTQTGENILMSSPCLDILVIEVWKKTFEKTSITCSFGYVEHFSF